MQQEQFTTLLNAPFTSSERSIEDVKKIAGEFPYFQSAHLLYAKLLKESNDIHYDQYLKIASAYSADRKRLYDLIKMEKSERESEGEGEKESEIENESVSVAGNRIEKAELSTSVENEAENNSGLPGEEKQQDAISFEQIINQRLEEIKQENAAKEKIIENEKEKFISKTAETIQSDKNNTEENIFIPAKSSPLIEITADNDVGVNNENSFNGGSNDNAVLPSGNENELPRSDIELSKNNSEKHSFLEWLALGKPMISNKEEGEKNILNAASHPEKISEPEVPVEKPKEEIKISQQEIIERFIKDQPRISPAKAAFFSPSIMARKSAEESDDLVSPTLAQIYLMQGNIQKAISTYQKLILLYPEKSAFFAARIEKIKKT